MKKLNKNFTDRYKIDDHKKVLQDILQWQQDIVNGFDSSVRLTDFVISMLKYTRGTDAGDLDPYVVKVQGYQVVYISRDWTKPLSIYSPLIGKFLAHMDVLQYYTSTPSPLLGTCRCMTHYAIEEVGISPLTDDTSKRLLLASMSMDNSFTRLCYEQRDSISAINHIRWLCQSMKVSDPLLAMTKLINSFSAEERKRILDVYDNYGTIDTLVGDALTHLDKFRSF